MDMSIENRSFVSTHGSTVNLPVYDCSFPSERFFSDLDEFFDVNDIAVTEMFKVPWSRLTGQAKEWSKLNIQTGVAASSPGKCFGCSSLWLSINPKGNRFEVTASVMHCKLTRNCAVERGIKRSTLQHHRQMGLDLQAYWPTMNYKCYAV